MLVIISDLHLTDGTTCTNISADAFNLFTERLRDLAGRAGWRSDGNYRPIEQIDLILLGDILDMLHSNLWENAYTGHPDYARPWDDPKSPGFIQKIASITDGILSHNAAAFVHLRDMSNGTAITVPAQPQDHPGEYVTSRQSVPVRIFYMVGNHDWYLHLPGVALNQIRRKIIKEMGLINPPARFPHDINEWSELERTCRAHGVLARHGDVFDPINYDQIHGRDSASLSDALAIELVNRFPCAVQQAWGEQLPPEFFKNMHEMSNVRPALLIAGWIDGLIQRYCQTPALTNGVKEIWNDLVDQFLRTPFVRSLDKAFSFDIIDALEIALRFTKAASMNSLDQLLSFITDQFLGGDLNLSYAKFALREKAFQDHSAQHIVYGHTHSQEIVPLGTITDQSKTHNQICFNTGTWHSIYTPTRLGQHQFVGYQVMTYIAFFKGDERHGRPYESWSGTLAWEPASQR